VKFLLDILNPRSRGLFFQNDESFLIERLRPFISLGTDFPMGNPPPPPPPLQEKRNAFILASFFPQPTLRNDHLFFWVLWTRFFFFCLHEPAYVAGRFLPRSSSSALPKIQNLAFLPRPSLPDDVKNKSGAFFPYCRRPSSSFCLQKRRFSRKKDSPPFFFGLVILPAPKTPRNS